MADIEAIPQTTASARYAAMELDREDALSRARRASSVTIPTLLPPKGHTRGADLPTPWQSIGARGVNNLSSKLLLTMFPSTHPFFRARPAEKVQVELDKDADFKRAVTKALAGYEQGVMRDVDAKGDRVAAFEMNKHLLVAGNILVNDDVKLGLRLFALDRFVVRRDFSGQEIEIILRETFDIDSLPETAKALALSTNAGSVEGTAGNSQTRKGVDVYTVIRLREDGSGYDIFQEVGDQEVPGTRGYEPKDKMSWQALRMVRVTGEDYGRGYVEEYLGDLLSLEYLTKAIVDAAAAASKVLFLVKPNGTANIKQLSKAANGAFVAGNQDDVVALQLEKYADFRTAQEMVQMLTSRLELAFLLNTAVQRNAERVTAEEIRYVAEELEQGLGGIYSVLSQEFQLPYVKRRIRRLTAAKALPKLPDGVVEPIIITGLEALGRSMDRERLVRWGAAVTQVLGPDAIRRNGDERKIMELLGQAEGLTTDDLLLTPEQITANAQQEQVNGLLNRAAPQIAGKAGDALLAAQQPEGAPADGNQ